MKICYQQKRFRQDALDTIADANKIIEEYQQQGYSLTLRQIYYQFVSRDLIPNTVQSYKRLGGIISDARIAGLIDWEAIEDRTRNLKQLPHWESAAAIVDATSRQFRPDAWDRQPYRIEVWIEKEALAGVFERVCQELLVPFFCCRGYTSQSEVWTAAQRINEHTDRGQQVLILHFGDHDPSGIDMSRDIEDRLQLFHAEFEFKRIALNMSQVDQYKPPPNPAKDTDARFKDYREKFGDESWELDALDPKVLAKLVKKNVLAVRDEDAWELSMEELRAGRETLSRIAANWASVEDFLKTMED